MNIETKCVQGAYEPKNGEPRVFPIVQSTTYKYESSQEMGDLFDLKKEEMCIRDRSKALSTLCERMCELPPP